MSSSHTTIVVPIYEGVTQLDFTGPHQFFSRMPNAMVRVASVGARSIRADGLFFGGLDDLEIIEECDLICIPGGLGCFAAMENKRYMEAVRRLAASARYLTSVCTGSLILGAAGLLKGRRAACHWAYRDLLTLLGALPDASRVVRDGNVITGGGVTAGIDLALFVIAEIAGRDAAETVQLALEYAPAPPFDSGRPETACGAIHQSVSAVIAAAMPARRAVVERVAAELSTC